MRAKSSLPGTVVARSLVLGLLCLLTACASVTRLEKGALVAHGEPLDGAAEPLYYILALDLRQLGEVERQRLVVKLAAEAELLTLSALTPERVSGYLPRAQPPVIRRDAPAGEAYSGGGFYLRFEAGRLQFLGLCSHCAGGRQSPLIGRVGGELLGLPLTGTQLEALFGAPDRVYRVNEVRY
ncbi:hypothetical protein [Aestuariirhabdus litorea]|uniref:Lipoprotein n=1 Tax=Aestuariirhabdus litorea TaxID=2528527 RepID=A0A3P3VLL3_9GAMM|nr:hypothetical protein [Aestuariirhabdus litorea]RRJ82768.1 hypothetical protein D0544_13005 [Aestuariirhabdus litorea]RWW92928.1 hypothetical protein DZC74_12980 [Endozoicomonadaceae bacterium GTF-13]